MKYIPYILGAILLSLVIYIFAHQQPADMTFQNYPEANGNITKVVYSPSLTPGRKYMLEITTKNSENMTSSLVINEIAEETCQLICFRQQPLQIHAVVVEQEAGEGESPQALLRRNFDLPENYKHDTVQLYVYGKDFQEAYTLNVQK